MKSVEFSYPTIDVQNRLIIWTDYLKKTVEMLSLKPGSIHHATAASDRINPRQRWLIAEISHPIPKS